MDQLKTKAYVVPFAVFMGFLVLLQFTAPFLEWDHPDAPWWHRSPEQWIYPLQTVTCLILLIKWRKFVDWDWKLKPALIGVAFGLAGIGLWLLPTMAADRLPGGIAGYFGNPSFEWYRYFLGLDYRAEGFDPSKVFLPFSPEWCTAVAFRFLRAVIVVAVIEELFWRGFLMRFLIDDQHPFRVPFGTHSWKAYWVVTLAFMLVHSPVDYAGAFFYGTLTYILVTATKNLGAAIVMHATANLVLGYAAMSWQKYGLW